MSNSAPASNETSKDDSVPLSMSTVTCGLRTLAELYDHGALDAYQEHLSTRQSDVAAQWSALFSDADDVESIVLACLVSSNDRSCSPRAADTEQSAVVSAETRLLVLAEQYGIDSEDVDDLVHDVHSQEASDINNSGLGAQIRYLVDGCGDAELEARIRDTVAARLRDALEPVATQIDELATVWDAAEDIDTNLGGDVERAGSSLVILLRSVAVTIREADPLWSSHLDLCATDLIGVVEAYAKLDEHETDFSIDIFDRLGPAVGLVRRALTVVENPPADDKTTVERLASAKLDAVSNRAGDHRQLDNLEP